MTVPHIWEPHHGLEQPKPLALRKKKNKTKKKIYLYFYSNQISITYTFHVQSSLIFIWVKNKSPRVPLKYVFLIFYTSLCNKKSRRVVDTCGSKVTWRGSWWSQHPTRDCYPGPRGMIIMPSVSLSLYSHLEKKYDYFILKRSKVRC